jgi:sterol O-acyltransferase
MFQIPDYKALYNMSIASMLLVTLSLLVESSFEHIRQFPSIFSQVMEVAACWASMAAIAFLPVLLLRPLLLLPRRALTYLPLLAVYIYLLFRLPTLVMQQVELGFGSRMILLCEATRMSMKGYAYVRTKLLYCTENRFRTWSEGGRKLPEGFQVTLGSLGTELRRYGFYFFAPTLQFRDEYRLTAHRDWLAALGHFFNFLASVFYCFMVYRLLCVGAIEALFQEKLTLQRYVLCILRMVFPSMVFFLVGFFGFLHSWQAGWAELLRFPDRLFYHDWWNSNDFGSYYRRWNNVVHDFLYYYVYSDLVRFTGCRKSLAQLATFFISAVAHEVIINLSIGIFYPFLFILFAGPGTIFYFYQKQSQSYLAKNVFFWL